MDLQNVRSHDHSTLFSVFSSSFSFELDVYCRPSLTLSIQAVRSQFKQQRSTQQSCLLSSTQPIPQPTTPQPLPHISRRWSVEAKAEPTASSSSSSLPTHLAASVCSSGSCTVSEAHGIGRHVCKAIRAGGMVLRRHDGTRGRCM